MPLSFPKAGNCVETGRADPLVCSGPPGPAGRQAKPTRASAADRGGLPHFELAAKIPNRCWVIAILRIMSFLDNLENNLKALESRTERDPEALAREAAAREAARSAALEIAPHAEALRNGPFKDGLLTACREIGHHRRILVRPVWVDSTLRLEAGAKKLELRPTPNGVLAVFFDGGREKESALIDLSSDPVKVAERWLELNGT